MGLLKPASSRRLEGFLEGEPDDAPHRCLEGFLEGEPDDAPHRCLEGFLEGEPDDAPANSATDRIQPFPEINGMSNLAENPTPSAGIPYL